MAAPRALAYTDDITVAQQTDYLHAILNWATLPAEEVAAFKTKLAEGILSKAAAHKYTATNFRMARPPTTVKHAVEITAPCDLSFENDSRSTPWRDILVVLAEGVVGVVSVSTPAIKHCSIRFVEFVQ